MTTQTIIAAAAMLAAAGTASAQFYPNVGLGLSHSISDTGAVVGDQTAGASYWMWTAGNGAMEIGGTTAGNAVGGTPTISNDGTWVGGTVFNTNGQYHEMGRYDVANNAWTGLGGIGGQSGTEISSGWAITGDGSSVVGLGWVNAGGAHAIQWNQTDGTVDLGSTVTDRSSRANATNFDGTIVAGWQDSSSGFRQGAVWVNGTQQLITDGNGGGALEAFAVSDDGEWVTGMGFARFGVGNAYRYHPDTDTYQSLPNIAGGEDFMAGSAMTADGSTIVGGTWNWPGPATFGTAFIWRDGVGTMTLTDYFNEINFQYDAGYTFNFVSDISSDGMWMTGWGTDANGLRGSWVAHVPAPASAALLGLGGLVAVRRRR